MAVVAKPRTQLPPEWEAYVYFLQDTNKQQTRQLEEYDEKFKDVEVNDQFTRLYYIDTIQYFFRYNELLVQYQAKLAGYLSDRDKIIAEKDDIIASLEARVESLESVEVAPSPPDAGINEALTLEIENLKRYNSELQHKISCMKPSCISYSISVQTDDLQEDEDDILEPQDMVSIGVQTQGTANAEELVETITGLLQQARNELKNVQKNAGQHISYIRDKSMEKVKSLENDLLILKSIVEEHEVLDIERNKNYEAVMKTLNASEKRNESLKNLSKKTMEEYIKYKEENVLLKQRNSELSLYGSILTRSCSKKQTSIEEQAYTIWRLKKLTHEHNVQYDPKSLGEHVNTQQDLDEHNELSCKIMKEVESLNSAYPSEFHEIQLPYGVKLFLLDLDVKNLDDVLSEIKSYREMIDALVKLE